MSLPPNQVLKSRNDKRQDVVVIFAKPSLEGFRKHS